MSVDPDGAAKTPVVAGSWRAHHALSGAAYHLRPSAASQESKFELGHICGAKLIHCERLCKSVNGKTQKFSGNGQYSRRRLLSGIPRPTPRPADQSVAGLFKSLSHRLI